MTGRPRKFDNPEQLERLIEEYYLSTDVPTITGLCLYLGFESRQSFYDYEKNEGFSYIIKRARLQMEHEYEKQLFRTEGQVTGPIFALKNFGWKDRQDIEQTVTHLMPDVEIVPYGKEASKGD